MRNKKKIKNLRSYVNILRPPQSKGATQNLLKALLKISDKCFYCNCIVEKGTIACKQFDNQATVDHIYHSFDIRRHTQQGNTEVVLCCKKCNFNMGHKVIYYMSDEYYSLLYPPQDIFTLLNLTI